ncbi:MAG TPA: 3'(2'),5'-bisphosphate nucleotidase CysQ [Gemmatimonadaceae bacterium]|nr:3'(2'),5'-bisphosphate nucleotidase CysQ [Gemmatimonadaceae bacterium]
MSLLDSVISTAHAAGRCIVDISDSAQLAAVEKIGQGPVTAADRAADTLLREQLPALLPAAWLSEETADDPVRLSQSRVWIVDPLDGTKEFIAGLPEYAISIGLVDAGRPVLAVIHQPATGDTWWAESGKGAYLNGERIHATEGRRLLASRSETRGGEFADLAEWEIVPIGSIALKLAYVACGRGSVTISRGPKWEWDVCAGSLLVREAGGLCDDMFGTPMHFNKTHPKVRGVLAGAPAAAGQMLERLRLLGPSERMVREGLETS